MNREEFLKIIKNNIDKNDYYLTLVNGGQHPEFSYSIGLTEKLGFELIIPTIGMPIIQEEKEFIKMGIKKCLLEKQRQVTVFLHLNKSNTKKVIMLL